MDELDQLRKNTAKTYQDALRAVFDLLDAITSERDYYRELCDRKMDDNYGQRKTEAQP